MLLSYIPSLTSVMWSCLELMSLEHEGWTGFRFKTVMMYFSGDLDIWSDRHQRFPCGFTMYLILHIIRKQIKQLRHMLHSKEALPTSVPHIESRSLWYLFKSKRPLIMPLSIIYVMCNDVATSVLRKFATVDFIPRINLWAH